MSDECRVAPGVYCNKGDRILILEMHVEEVTSRLDKIEGTLEKLVSLSTREQVGRETVYTIGKWTIWMFMAVAAVFGWDRVAAWLAKNPL